MRTLDLALGALGLTALGLMLSSVPAVQASTSEGGIDSARQTVEIQPGVESTLDNLQIDGPSAEGEEWTQARKDAEAALGCCTPAMTPGLSPAERAARARTLRRVLLRDASSERSTFDQLRLDLLLHRESHLTAAEEREIS